MKRDIGKARQRGVASIEFAFVFIIIFAIFYGMIGYFIPLLLSASYQEIASEAVREAVLHNYDSGGSDRRQELAREVVEDSWLPPDWAQSCDGYPAGGYLKETDIALDACVRHANPSSIIPQIPLFGLKFPPLPDEIRGQAVILRSTL